MGTLENGKNRLNPTMKTEREILSHINSDIESDSAMYPPKIVPSASECHFLNRWSESFENYLLPLFPFAIPIVQ